jgi:hypothetical protein
VFALAPDGAVPAGVEPITAVHHDHIFVPVQRGEQARAVRAALR